jgi:hypothetical protein
MDVGYGQEKPLSKNSKDSGLVKIDTLRTATVIGVIRPRMKGDTIEYNTEHFAAQPNAVAEDLLRRLPGLQIDINGNITYNGEKISHLLVDGEDIFGNNPALVTRNFDASKIARVQILDRKNDQVIFTGVDDGARSKTLNLVLKESAKNGYFGKVEVGGNTNGFYNGNLAAAVLRDREQIVILGMTSNTGSLSFTSDAGGTTTAVGFLNGISDPLGTSAGSGIPRFNAVALHYGNSWNGPVDHVSGNFQYSHFFTQPTTTIQSFQTQQDSVYGQYQQSISSNQYDQSWVFATFDWLPNAAMALRFTVRGNHTNEQNQFGATETSTFNYTLINSSERTIQDQMIRQNSGGDLAWRVRIGKPPNRILSLTASITQISPAVNGYLYSINRFYQSNGQLQSVDTVDQRKEIVSHPVSAQASINYVEPLWKGAALASSYGVSFDGDRPRQMTYNRGNGKYDEVVDSLSSQIATQVITQRVTLNLQGKTGLVNYTVGNDWIGYAYHQRDLMLDSTLRLHYLNFAPRVLVNFIPNPATRFGFNYDANTQEPTIDQLAPITNNSDPLHISLGNPKLKPTLNQAFRLSFHRFKVWYLSVSFNTNLSGNMVSTKTVTDSLGRQISQPVNVTGGQNSSLRFSLGKKLLGFNLTLNTSATYSRTPSYVNADLSRNSAYTGGGGISLYSYMTDKYSLELSTNFTYFDQVSSINSSASVRYWTQSHTVSTSLYFIKEFVVNTNATFTWQEKTGAFTGKNYVLLWNANISRNFWHSKLAIKAQLNNILNQSAGITRSNVSNVNTQSTTNILGQYWMIGATYHFDKKIKRK